MSRIAIKDLKALAEKRGLTHVITWAFDDNGKTQHIATFGKSVEQCSQAADFGNKLKDALGWPNSLHAEPARVRKVQSQLKETESKYNKVMSLLRSAKMKHGRCEPRSEKACTHCNAQDELDALISEYKGAPIRLI